MAVHAFDVANYLANYFLDGPTYSLDGPIQSDTDHFADAQTYHTFQNLIISKPNNILHPCRLNNEVDFLNCFPLPFGWNRYDALPLAGFILAAPSNQKTLPQLLVS